MTTEQTDPNEPATPAPPPAADVPPRQWIAEAHGLPPEWAERLQGESLDDLHADADRLHATLKELGALEPPPPTRDLGQGVRGSLDPPPPTGNDWFRGRLEHVRYEGGR